MKEKHADGLLYFKCVVTGCKTKLIRRSYLTKHLKKIHKLDSRTVRQLVADVVLETDNSETRTPLAGNDENISDAKDTHPYEDVSDGEFDTWLDNQIENDKEPTLPLQVPENIATEPELKESSDIADMDISLDYEEPTLDEVYKLAEHELRENTQPSRSNETPESDVHAAKNSSGEEVDNESVDHASTAARDSSGEEADNESVDLASTAAGNSSGEEADNESVDRATAVSKYSSGVDSDNEPADPVLEISSDDSDHDDDYEQSVEFFNVTLKTTKSVKNGEVRKTDRVASIAFSQNFNPSNLNPMEIIQRVQQEFVEFIDSCKN